MNKSIVDWLTSKPFRSDASGIFGPTRDGWTLIDRLAELIHVNGGPEVRGWGYISSGNPLYGRSGLEQHEALELHAAWAFACGWCEGQPEPTLALAELQRAIETTWEACEAALPERQVTDAAS